jgi:pyridoxamine 5'-phosphate oxidase
MDYADCTKFANENPVSYIATTEGDQPRVRAFLMWFADESGFYYHTGEPKSVCKQLHKNSKIEVCFFNPKGDLMSKNMMRVAGVVEFLDRPDLRARLLEERPFLKAVVSGPEDKKLAIFRIAHGEAWFWSMAENMREAETPRVKF